MLGRRRTATGRRDLGQGLVEFAVVLPVFLAMCMGIVDLGRAVWANDTLSAASREAARYASVHGGADVITCPTGPSLTGSPATGCPSWSPDSKEPTRTVARGYLVAPGSSVTVTVCYYVTTPCTGNTDETAATNDRGAFVTVKVSSRIDLFLPSLLGMSGFNMSSTSTVIVNN
jgi:Flp pilus assembly protein TadG